MAYGVTVENLDRVRANLAQAPDLIQEESTAGAKRLINVMVPLVKRYTPVDTGATQAAIGGVIVISQNLVTGTIEADGVKPVVVESLEHGTAPHWAPWGPGTHLAAWAERKGIPPFLVARAIANHGTIKRFGRPKGGAKMFERGFKDAEPAIPDTAMQVGYQIAKRLAG